MELALRSWRVAPRRGADEYGHLPAPPVNERPDAHPAVDPRRPPFDYVDPETGVLKTIRRGDGRRLEASLHDPGVGEPPGGRLNSLQGARVGHLENTDVPPFMPQDGLQNPPLLHG